MKCIFESMSVKMISFSLSSSGGLKQGYFFSNRWLLIIKKYMCHEVLFRRPPAMSGLGDDVRAQ